MQDINLLGHEEQPTKTPARKPARWHWTDPKKSSVDSGQPKISFWKKIFGGNASARIVKEKTVAGPGLPGRPAPQDPEQWRQVLEKRRAELEQSASKKPASPPPVRPVLPNVTAMPEKFHPTLLENPPAQKPSSLPSRPTAPTSPVAPAPPKPHAMPTVIAARMHSDAKEHEQHEDQDALHVNLMSEASKEADRAKRQKRIGGAIVLASFGLVLIGVIGLWTYRMMVRSDMKELDEKMSQVQQKISQMADVQTQAASLSERVAVSQSTLDQQVQWSRIFTLLEDTTLPDVYFSSLTVSDTGKITLEAVARSYRTATEQAMIFEQQSEVDSATLINLTQATESRTSVDEAGQEVTIDMAVVTFGLEVQLTNDALQLAL